MVENALEVTVSDEEPDMPFSVWLATEGGTRCPQCGRFAKREDLGNLSFSYGNGRVSMYGHKPGRGCNVARKPEAEGS